MHLPYKANGPDGPYETSERGFNDQISWAIDELKRNPMSRRVVVSAWAPGNAQMSKLPPCHAMFVLNVQNMNVIDCTCPELHYADERLNRRSYGPGYRSEHRRVPEQDRFPHHHLNCAERLRHSESRPLVTEQRLCLHLTQRSCDIALGIPYNIASYSLFLELFSRFTGVAPGIFAHTLVDAHAYTAKPDGSMAEFDHVPGLREQLAREPRALPRLKIDESIRTLKDVEALLDADTETVMSKFLLDGYNPWPAISFKVAV